MIRVIQSRKWDFEIPNSCHDCPMIVAEHDSGYTMHFCQLKHNDDLIKNMVSDKVVDGRDKDCPLKDGETFYVGWREYDKSAHDSCTYQA